MSLRGIILGISDLYCQEILALLHQELEEKTRTILYICREQQLILLPNNADNFCV